MFPSYRSPNDSFDRWCSFVEGAPMEKTNEPLHDRQCRRQFLKKSRQKPTVAKK
ncbi:hypothetical protein KIN20_004284 [Parelaphostrongylus tenuis]|uniref:Uncharacterized protein n=1 Tax=Parelaphostrongylus tenuis TaxID=148309 RepID=A0AAD5QEC1_PARTN|nr:hypothetical protein KIN20_004284 [Parelaphostrongylus tenuis]